MGASHSIHSMPLMSICLKSTGQTKFLTKNQFIRLSSYTGEPIPILGIFNVNVSYCGKNYNLPLVFVVKGKSFVWQKLA